MYYHNLFNCMQENNLIAVYKHIQEFVLYPGELNFTSERNGGGSRVGIPEGMLIGKNFLDIDCCTMSEDNSGYFNISSTTKRNTGSDDEHVTNTLVVGSHFSQLAATRSFKIPGSDKRVLKDYSMLQFCKNAPSIDHRHTSYFRRNGGENTGVTGYVVPMDRIHIGQMFDIIRQIHERNIRIF